MRLTLLVLFFYSTFSQINAQDWIKDCVPPDLSQTCLIVEKIDSIGMKCKKGRSFIYCNNFDKDTDSKLINYQKQQEQIIREYNKDFVLVHPKAFPYQEFTEFKDLDKYRYILRMNIVEAGFDRNLTYHYVYYFYDRKLKKELPRIRKVYDQKFKSLKEIIDGLNQLAVK